MSLTTTLPAGAVVLEARTAADLMTVNPLSLREDATLREAVAFLVDRNISGAPVIDHAGRPVGVLTQTDVMIHDREEVEHLSTPEVEYGTPLPRSWWNEFQIERVDTTPVRDVMTPAVFCVALDTPVWSVISQMRDLNVHRLFVVDEQGVLVGVITAMDIVRQLAMTGRTH
ncbi:MAG: CBS domain-containing protein [Gemmataceae bacterium]